VDGGTQRNVYFKEQGFNGSGLHFRTGYDITTETTYGVARSLELASLVTTNRFARVGGMLVITYEFTVSGTTTVLNSLMIGGVDTAGQIPGTTTGVADSWGRDILIEEPGPITMVSSGICIFTQSSAPAAQTLNVAVGDQGYTAYTMSKTNSFELGPHSLVHRIDGGGTNATAFGALARGRNYYEFRIYASASNNWWNLCGFVLLNYTSSVASQGVGAHAQSRYFLIAPNTATTAVSRLVTGTGLLLGTDESDYWLIGAIVEINIDHGTIGTCYSYTLNAERNSGEGEGEGWEPIFYGQSIADNERNCTIRMYSAARSSFKRYPNDQDSSRMSLSDSREWRLDTPTTCYTAWGVWATIHTITYTISGDVTGSNGGTVNLVLHRELNGDRLLTTSRVGNGAYSFTWYDNTENVYVSAYETNDYIGRSGLGTAS
jgi:hypothetical protein